MSNKLLAVAAGVIILLSAIVIPSFVKATHLTTLWCRTVLRGSAIPGPTAPFCYLLGLGVITNTPTTFNTLNTAVCPPGYVRTSTFQCTPISNLLTPGILLSTLNTANCPPSYVQTSAFQCTPIYNVINPGTLLPSNNYYSPPRILSHSAYTDNIGTLHIVGEVINQSPFTAKFVKIIATLYNTYNQVIGTQFSYTQPSDLAPGQRAPFDILVLSGGIPLNQMRTYTLSVSTS